MKYSFSLDYAQEIKKDQKRLQDALPGITIPDKCRSGRDIFYMVPHNVGDKIDAGDVLLEILFYRTDNSYRGHYANDLIGRHKVISEISGYVFHDISPMDHYSIDGLSSPIEVFSSIDELVEEKTYLQYEIETDEFTSRRVLKWNWNEHNEEDFELLHPVFFALNNGAKLVLDIDKDLPILRISYSTKGFKEHRNVKVHFKFVDGSILSFSVLDTSVRMASRVQYVSIRVPLSASAISQFQNCGWEKLRVDHPNGEAAFTIENEMDEHSGAYSQSLFKFYTKRFYSALAELGIIPTSLNSNALTAHDNPVFQEDACYVYLMLDAANGYYKIGMSNHPEYRERTLQSEKPSIVKICAKRFPTRLIAQSIESALHNVYAAKRVRGEWFDLTELEVAQIKETLS